MTTMADVARRAGVSLSTVSHVINETRYVKPETVEAVRAAVAEMGYTPNTLARSLARSATNSVGIAISAVSNPYFSDIIRAIESECSGLGMTVFLVDTNDQPKKELEVIQALHQRRVDGIILAPCSDSDQSALTYLEENKIPTVLVDRLASRKFDQVGVQNAKAVEQLVDHLVEHGHKKIGMIPGQPGFATTQERIEGFLAGLKRHHIALEEGFLAAGSADLDAAARAAVKLLSRLGRPTALITGNNLATIGTMRGIRRLNLRVPDDVALVGFDDFEWAAAPQKCYWNASRNPKKFR